MVTISRLALVRRKSVYYTSASAWKDIIKKNNVKASQVRASHSKLAWIWTPKPNSNLTLKKTTKRKSKGSSKKSKSKVTVKTTRKDFRMCKHIDAAMKNPKVKRIIINK